ncbi:MAG: hypothetical protein IT424_05275 [Pirellulales bacterium]|nr:hypothetical protein [Pirellulales bacterium]
MTTYEFTLILQGSLELTEETADRLFEAGCNDGSPGSCGGVLSIDFHRADESLEAAIASAIRDVRCAGFEVERIEMSARTLPISA